MPNEAAGALSGAASGAAAGSAFGPWGTAIGAVVGGVGGYLSGSGTAQAQKEANRAAAQAAAAQSAQQFFNYLSSRGIDLMQAARSNPAYEQEYNRIRALGEKRDFQTWLYEHLKASPGDDLWDVIANPAGTGAAANTTLPAWAVDANGQPLQPSLLQDIVESYTFGGDKAAQAAFQAAQADPFGLWLANHPQAKADWDANVNGVQDYYSGDFRAMVEDNINNLGSTAEKAAKAGTLTPQILIQERAANPDTPAAPGSTAAPAGPAGIGNPTTIDPAITELLSKATDTLSGVYDGTYLNQVLAGLDPIKAARDAAAAAQAARVEELRGLSGNLLSTELGGIGNVLDARTAGAGGIYDASAAGAAGVRDATKTAAQGVNDATIDQLAQVLGVRRDVAEQIFQATQGAAGGVRDARTTGASGIYNAELLRADTIAQSAKQALDRVLAGQAAERARRGFTGGSSGTDITRARLMSDALQRGAGARADAGVNYQTRLSDAGIGYASDIGTAGINRATQLGQASEQDAIAKLNAAVELARQLGLADTNYATSIGNAGVTRATSLASAGEQNAIAQLQAKVADATRRLGYLTSDADIAQANADLQNAQDSLNALLADQNRKIGAVGAPFDLASADLALKNKLTDQQYGGLDAILKRLGSFTTSQASGPQITVSTPSPVLNGSQIAGGALSSIGSIIGSASSNNSLEELIKKFLSPSATTGGTSSNGGSLFSSPSFLSNASVFAGPG